jgi:hypothetical protein
MGSSAPVKDLLPDDLAHSLKIDLGLHDRYWCDQPANDAAHQPQSEYMVTSNKIDRLIEA